MENAQANKADFYVSPDGSDSWSGTLEKPTVDRTDGPFLTPFKARDAVRGLGDARRDILVLFRGGSYSLHKTFVLGLEDSAADGHTVT